MLPLPQSEESRLRESKFYNYLTNIIDIYAFQKENNITEIISNESLKDIELEKNAEKGITLKRVKQIEDIKDENIEKYILNDEEYKLEDTNYHFINDIINFMEEKNKTFYSKTNTNLGNNENIEIINVQSISQENQNIQIFSHEITYLSSEENKYFKETALNTEAQENA